MMARRGLVIVACLALVDYAESNYIFPPLPFLLNALLWLDASFSLRACIRTNRAPHCRFEIPLRSQRRINQVCEEGMIIFHCGL